MYIYTHIYMYIHTYTYIYMTYICIYICIYRTYIYVLSLLSPPHLTSVGSHRASGWAPCAVEQLPAHYPLYTS